MNFVCLHPWNQELYSGANDRNLVVWTYRQSPRETAYEEYLEEERRKTKEGEGGGGVEMEETKGWTKVQAYMDAWSDYSDDEVIGKS